MDSKSDVFRTISAVMIGAAAGTMMAVLLLVLLQKTGFTVNRPGFYLIALAAGALPLCLDVLRRREIQPAVSELVMILLSGLICFGYALMTAANELAAQRMRTAVLLVHLPAVLVYAAQWMAALIKRGKQDS